MRDDRTASLPALRAWLLALTALASVAFVVVALLVTAHESGTALDLAVAPALVQTAVEHPAVAGVGRVLDVLGGTVVAVLAVAAASAWLLVARHVLLAACLVASALGILLNSAVKYLVDRPRPATVGLLLDESTPSFTSGHATSSITVIAALGIVALVAVRSRWRWALALPLFALVPLIGLSRVFMGVHWPTDVLGGWALGAAWTSMVALLAILIATPRAGPVLSDERVDASAAARDASG